MHLVLIYSFNSSQNLDGEFRPASYQVVHFFSGQGFLELKLLRELAKSLPEADHHQLKFLNLDDLRAFALRVCQELHSPEVRLISVQDYNIGVDGARDRESYRGIFKNFGEVVINEAAQKKKGLLKKFFGPH
jgi:hypothetical protein